MRVVLNVTAVSLFNTKRVVMKSIAKLWEIIKLYIHCPFKMYASVTRKMTENGVCCLWFEHIVGYSTRNNSALSLHGVFVVGILYGP